MTKGIKVAAYAAILGCFIAAVPAQAEPKGCQSIKLILQANLDLDRPFPYKGWSGKVRGLLNDTIPINGEFYGYPGEPVPTQYSGQVGHEYMKAVIDLGPAGKMVTSLDRSIAQYSPSVSPHFSFPPALAYGRTMSQLKIVQDSAVSSGWFVNATGNISVMGIFVVNGQPPVDFGFWNAEITGNICQVAIP